MTNEAYDKEFSERVSLADLTHSPSSKKTLNNSKPYINPTLTL